MAYGNVNVDTVTTSTAGGILGAGNASIMKNRIINGAMTISQYNGTSSYTPSNAGGFLYVIDRFGYYASQASKFTFQQLSASPPVGFSNYLGCTVASAVTVGATDIFTPYQFIEGFNTADLGWGTANAKTVTLSFQVYSSLTGTFGGSLMNSAYNRSYPFTYTISSANTWTSISITIAGDTSGTWIGATNGIGLRVIWGLGVGSTFSGTAGSWSGNQYWSATGATSVVGTSGATFYITGVQLEVGNSATGFEYVNYQTSLANCQRYYTKLGLGASTSGIAMGATTTTTTAQVVIPLHTTMRASPTATISNMAITDWQTYTVTSLSINFTGANPDSVLLNITGSGFTAYRPCFFTLNTTAGYTDFSAEL